MRRVSDFTIPEEYGHAGAVALILALGALIAWPAFGFPPTFPPFAADNVDALALSTRSDPTVFFTHAGEVWRPVSYFTLWAQYQLAGLDIGGFFGVNILLWGLCALFVYLLAYVHTGLVLAAAGAGLMTLTDGRFFTPLVWIVERQTMLACIFGVIGLLVAHQLASTERRRTGSMAGLFVLLLLSALSKEFGLAFAFGVATIGLLRARRPRELVVVGVGAVVVYGALRGLVGGLDFGAGGGDNRGFGESQSSEGRGLCQTVGFGANPRDICYGDLTLLGQLAQFAWNIGASFVGIFFPSVIGDNGNLLAPDVLGSALGGPSYYEGFAFRSLPVPLVVSALAIVAWLKRPAIALPLLAVIVANAVLDFQYYRERNIIVGMVALHVAAAIGIAPSIEILKPRLQRLGAWIKSPSLLRSRLRMSGATVLALVLVVGGAVAIASRASDLAEELEGARGGYEARDPCDAADQYGSEMPERLRRKYGLPGGCPPQPPQS